MDKWIIYALAAVNLATFLLYVFTILVPLFLVLHIALAGWILWRLKGC